MAKVLVITDSADSAKRNEVADELKKAQHTVVFVGTAAYSNFLRKSCDAYIVWVDSFSKSHAIVRDIREKKYNAKTQVSIAVLQPSVLAIGSGISVVHEVSDFKTALYNMLSAKKEAPKKIKA